MRSRRGLISFILNMSSYIYRGEPEQRVFGALPEGDYAYVVADCGEPYQKDSSGNWVLSLKLSIQPSGASVFANPWSGVTKDGEERDGIGEFLLSCNRAPKPGDEPEWGRLIGAKGKCRLKVEIAAQGSLAGKEVNKVAWFHRPKQVGPTSEPTKQSFTEAELKASQAAIAKTLGVKDPDLDVEPDDIPF
jgi:hypothetical protein